MRMRGWALFVVGSAVVLGALAYGWISHTDEQNDPALAAQRLRELEVDVDVPADTESDPTEREALQERAEALTEELERHFSDSTHSDEELHRIWRELDEVHLKLYRPDEYAARMACGSIEPSVCSAMALWGRRGAISETERIRALREAREAGDEDRERELFAMGRDWEHAAIQEAFEAGEGGLARDMTLASQRPTSARQWTPERRMAQKWGLLLANYAPSAQVEIIQAAELVGRDSQLFEPLAWLGGHPACDVRKSPQLMVVCSPHYPYEY